MASEMERRERVPTSTWNLVQDAGGNTVAVNERVPQSGSPEQRARDLGQLLLSIQSGQTMDALALRTALATTHNTLADMHNRTDAKITAYVKNHLQTNLRLDRVIADQQASNALVADTARKMAEVATGLQRILEQTKASQDRMADRSMKAWIADPGNQLAVLAATVIGGLLSVGVFVFLRSFG